MRVLALILTLTAIGCNEPDFWTCDKDRQEAAAKFYAKCTDNFDSSDQGGACMNRMHEIYCKPGYKEHLAPNTRPPEDSVKEVIEAVKEGFESSP